MIAAFLLLLSWGTLGLGLARATAEPLTEPLEIALRAAVGGFATWVAASWALAFAGLLFPSTVIVAACLAAAGGAVLHLRIRRRPGAEEGEDARTVPPALLAVVIPVSLWIVYAALRATVVPVGNHDAIAYHFPRAVLFILDHGYRFHAEIPEPRLTTFPANYELLLATVLAAFGSDGGTVLIELAAFLAFGLVSANLARRWWSSPLAPLLAFALTCSTPLALLHSAANKNDLLFSFFAAAGTQWLVRFALGTKRSDAVWGICAIGLALGTKSNGAPFAAALAPFVVVGLLRARSRSTATAIAAAVVTAALGLGGIVIAVNVVKTGGLGLGVYDFHNKGGPLYSDWHNLWRFPIALLAAPFTSSDSLWVPWSDERYWWSEYNIFFGHYGAALTLGLIAIPFAERWLAPRESRLERCLMLAVPIVVACVVLPTRARPYGFFTQQARYSLAFVPLALAWTSGVAGAFASRMPENRRMQVVAAVAGVWFARNAWRMGERDDYQPFAFVVHAALAEKPIQEPLAQGSHRRVGYLVDRVAGPRDVVAVEIGFDTWLYPMFGADHQRPVRFIARPTDGQAVIPPEATWVAIDLDQQEVFFTHPALVDFRLSLMRRYFGHGKLGPKSFVTLRQVEADPAFELVYIDRPGNQALFRRRASL